VAACPELRGARRRGDVSRRLTGVQYFHDYALEDIGLVSDSVCNLFVREKLLQSQAEPDRRRLWRGPLRFSSGRFWDRLFLTAFDLPKAVYISTAGAIALFIDTTRLTTYFANGAKLPTLLLYGLPLFIPASFLGAALAKRIVDRIPQQHFRKIVAVFLLLMGIKLLLLPG
jgi:hypothetical protein